MKRLIFYVDAEWSMGRFHSDLVKFLFKEGIESQIIDYKKSYTMPELHEQIDVNDYFISNGSGVAVLINSYRIPPEKCIPIILHTVDIKDLIAANVDIKRLPKVAAIADWLIPHCGIFNKEIYPVKFGINTLAFRSEPSQALSRIGYGAAYHSREETEHWKQIDIGQPKVTKRGYLVKEIAEEMNLPFKSAHPDRRSFVTMPGFYKSIDVIICASSDEGAGGPVLEGGAAGKLILTTATGGFSDFVTTIGADVIPVEEQALKEEAKRLLHYYIDNPIAYRERCYQIQDYALKKYDLSNAIQSWLDLISA
jgi:hypothetical protein